MEIGVKIKHLLDLKNMSMKDLATTSNMPLSTLSDLINGKTKKLSIQKAKDICIALGCSLDYLVDDDCALESSPLLDEEIIIINRAAKKMNQDQKKKMLNILQLTFEEEFK